MAISLTERRERDRMRKRLRRYLDKGGVLKREVLGGSIAVRWASAHRCGPAFPAPLCERWVCLGKLAEVGAAAALFGRPPATPAQEA